MRNSEREAKKKIRKANEREERWLQENKID